LVAAFSATSAFAEVAIETSVSHSRVAVGDRLALDIIITGASGKIAKPVFPPIEGFSSYSQGHSQEISIVNGRMSSRSIFSYVLIANSEGRKTIGPFEINIDGRTFKAAPIQVEVVHNGSSAQSYPSQAYSQAPVVAPPPRALPGAGVSNRDIFVKTWLDKDEVYVNEPAMLTYTIYTRLSATYKGFEKEPVTTGFWVEDFPPEKTVKRTEQILDGSRYVVADIRKMALFPTQVGVFTLEPGTIAATVEVREQDNFDSFFSYNIFGRRSGPAYSSPVMTQVFSKVLPTDPLRLTVKALPEAGKPASFTGAVGGYQIQSSVDKTEVEEGSPVTYRVRIGGQGNINTIQTPSLPKMEGFKIYDSSSSVNISKNRLVVEGEKVTETVLVPKKAGTYTIPALEFASFDPRSGNYKTLKTSPHTLVVKPGPEPEPEASVTPGAAGIEPAEKADIAVMGKDIRYIKSVEAEKAWPVRDLYKKPLYWAFNAGIILLSFWLMFFTAKRESVLSDLKGLRFRHSHKVARRRLKTAARFLKKDKKDEFYAEISKALSGYFADKLGQPAYSVTPETIGQGLPPQAMETASPALTDAKALFQEIDLGRFARVEKSREEMKKIYEMADKVITQFEKVKLK